MVDEWRGFHRKTGPQNHFGKPQSEVKSAVRHPKDTCQKISSFKLVKCAKQLAGKLMVSVLWNTQGMLFIDYIEKGKTNNSGYYLGLLERLTKEIMASTENDDPVE